MLIRSFAYSKPPPPADLTIDCRGLPNPHQIPGLRPRDGRSPLVRDWLLAHHEVTDLINRTAATAAGLTTINVGCSAGRHRSVVVANELASRLGAEVTHMALKPPKRKTTTERGLGRRHQIDRERLLAMHTDGTPCWWCGEPMYRSQKLDADHTRARVAGGQHADRLLHSSCNRSRGDGSRDHLRPAGAPLEARTGQAAVFDWG